MISFKENTEIFDKCETLKTDIVSKCLSSGLPYNHIALALDKAKSDMANEKEHVAGGVLPLNELYRIGLEQREKR